MRTRRVTFTSVLITALMATAPAAVAAQADQAGERNRTSTDRPVPGVWERLAECESGGNWHLNTGNGYYGGLQFLRSTWAAYGGEKYAHYPHRASKGEQIAIGRALRDARGGYGAWPYCARKLGLPH